MFFLLETMLRLIDNGEDTSLVFGFVIGIILIVIIIIAGLLLLFAR